MDRLEKFFEQVLWGTRLVTLVAVVASALLAVGMFYLSSLDAGYLLRAMAGYRTLEVGQAQRLEILAGVIEVLDSYLLAAVMFLLSIGLYELFVSRIDLIERSTFAGRLLRIHSLDDLKDRLAKVIVLMLVAKFFQQALKLKYETPLDLLYLAMGTLLMGGALWLTHRRSAPVTAEADPGH